MSVSSLVTISPLASSTWTASLPHLVANIQKRGRDYEQTIPLEYLSGLNERYDDFIFHKYKGSVLVVDVDDIDFEHNPKDFASIIDKIDARLFNLFPENI